MKKKCTVLESENFERPKEKIGNESGVSDRQGDWVPMSITNQVPRNGEFLQ